MSPVLGSEQPAGDRVGMCDRIYNECLLSHIQSCFMHGNLDFIHSPLHSCLCVSLCRSRGDRGWELLHVGDGSSLGAVPRSLPALAADVEAHSDCP